MLKDIIAELDNLKDVRSYSELKVWSLNRNKFSAAVKIAIDSEKFSDVERRDAIK
jgi:Co/Zn/Cd efflux system component